MITDEEVAKKLIAIHNSAESRKIPCTLSLKKVRSLLSAKKCFYTGRTFINDGGDRQRSFDRVNNKMGYFDNNVVPCIALINRIKSNGSIDDFKLIINGMEKFEKRRKKTNVNKLI